MKMSLYALWRLALAVTLVLTGLLPTLAYAQADDSATPASVDASGSGSSSATLACTAIALPIATPDLSGNRFVCRVDGAQPTDTGFSVLGTRATAEPQPTATQRLSACNGSLSDGVGICLGGFVDRTSALLGQLSFTATLEPSGAALGPVALAVPSELPQPRQLTPPPAPVNSFPLPEP